MNRRMHIFVELALLTGFLTPVALAQKPPAGPTNPAIPGSVQPNQPREDLVMFLLGRVATSDGTPVPNDALVERVCNAGVRQQVHISSRGEFNMQLGSRTDSFLDASGGQASQADLSGKNSERGIPRRELANC